MSSKVYTLRCRICDRLFKAGRSDARYCSAKCRQQISRATKGVTVPTIAREQREQGKAVIRPKGK